MLDLKKLPLQLSNEYTLEKVFYQHRLKCLVVFTVFGYRCGYVGVTPQHPYFRVYYSSLYPQIVTHGGLTYSNVDYPLRDGRWYFGFDCGHMFDGRDLDSAKKYGYDIYSSVIHPYRERGVIRTMEYVQNECISIAEQFITLTGKHFVKIHKSKKPKINRRIRV